MTGIHPRHLRDNVIAPALRYIDAYSPAAADLVLGTAAQESRLGTYLRQLGQGPALGPWQMEPATSRDIRDNWLAYKPDIMGKVSRLRVAATLGIHDDAWSEQLAFNLAFGAAMCRVHYMRKPGAIPATVEGQAAYWKAHYNTPLGAGTEAEYIENWRTLVAPGLA